MSKRELDKDNKDDQELFFLVAGQLPIQSNNIKKIPVKGKRQFNHPY